MVGHTKAISFESIPTPIGEIGVFFLVGLTQLPYVAGGTAFAESPCGSCSEGQQSSFSANPGRWASLLTDPRDLFFRYDVSLSPLLPWRDLAGLLSSFFFFAGTPFESILTI